ncbi:MAG: hydrogen gas-evolving membrane-bound hydrogenase subunit E [Bacillota bacterium]|nr:hydrogen gas-evolving membrane-bound hydrogenase subunit E [Bacillota bacterium]MDW7683328.1 hydrogen gas-evolving membrane-bound hydrogenase subunit E [Bacillota bacterium]
MRNVLVVIFLALIMVVLVITVIEMPAVGDPANITNNEVPQRYLEDSIEETGALNVIASIITDYRAFDTLGEATVLFVAIAAVLSNLKAH